MKIAFSVENNETDLSQPIFNRFGRAPYFLIFDDSNSSVMIIDNRSNLDADHGAGIQSSESLSKAGVTTLITHHCGPKAFRVLNSADIQVYVTEEKTISEAIASFQTGKLKKLSSPDITGHSI